jgi:HipA-like protein
VPRHLVVLSDGERMGVVTQGETGALRFEYDGSWRAAASSFPLSLSMPLVTVRHDGPVVRAFLEGLLPDDPELRQRWGRRFGVSPNNPFSLLEHMGADCPGALQFLREEAVEAIVSGAADGVSWHTEADVAEILRALAERRGVGRLSGSGGYFSLAGAQPKTALLLQEGRWGTPMERIPTTVWCGDRPAPGHRPARGRGHSRGVWCRGGAPDARGDRPPHPGTPGRADPPEGGILPGDSGILKSPEGLVVRRETDKDVHSAVGAGLLVGR